MTTWEDIELPHQPSIGDQCAEAIEAAAKAKTEALRCRKQCERIWDRIFLSIDGKNIAEREAKARHHIDHIVAEDAALIAESDAILAKGKADAWQIKWETWRTQAATDRAEMNLR